MTEYTRDEYIAQFGTDPDEDMADPKGGGVADHLKSAIVGAVGIPTDAINLLPTIKRGAAALINSYGTDKKFLDEFYDQTHITGARQNVQDHLDTVVESWKQQDPSLSDDDINKGIEDYKKTKDFEEFTMSQLANTQWLTSKVKDTTRRLLGDERPESQRSWTESAAEAVGGALVPGPQGWANAARVGLTGVPILGRAANSLVGRGTLRTAEALTPLTMPYTPANIAVNAGAGIAIDQATRWATGESTAFTPTDTDDSGIGTLAATGLGIAGIAAFAAAIKGRNTRALQQLGNLSPTERAVLATPSVDLRAPDELKAGEASILGGVERQADPYASLDEQGAVTATARRVTDAFVDRGHTLTKAVEDESGLERAIELAHQRTALTGSILNDRVRAHTEVMLRPVLTALDAMPAGERRAAQLGWQMAALKADRNAIIQHLDDRVNSLNHTITNSQDPAAVTRAQSELAVVQNDRMRLINDDPDARIRIPDVARQYWEPIADKFIADQSPRMMRLKREIKAWADRVLDMQVAQGTLSRPHRDLLRTRNEFYVPTIDDPLKGARGVRRLYRSIVNNAKSSLTKDSMGVGGSVGRESPIEKLDLDVNQPYTDFQKRFRESRVTRPLEPAAAIRRYTEDMLNHVSKTMMRNTHLRELGFVGPNVYSRFYRDGYIDIVRVNGREWFSAAELDNPATSLQKHLDDRHVVPEWDNGRVRLWKLGDIEMASALRADPVITTGAVKSMSTATRWFKMLTTGYGNPFWAIKGAGYDTSIGMLTRNAGRAFGGASYLAHRFLPESIARGVVGRIPDPTAIPGAVVHSFKALGEVHAHYFARFIATKLENQNGAFKVLASAMGQPAYQRMVHAATRLSYITANLPTLRMIREGVAHSSGTVDNIHKVRDAHAMMRDAIPNSLHAAWTFYRDVINAVYLGPKRMFFTENHALLANRYRGAHNIPQGEVDRLIAETRALGGNMALVPANKKMQDIEAMVPYLTQTKLGTYHLMSNMFGKDTYSYVLPRTMMMMYGIGQSMYMMTYWNDESRNEYWKRTSEYDRWRFIVVPTMKLAMAWANGGDLPYSRDLYYKIPLPPDLVGIVAGTGAIMQTLGMLPANMTPTPISRELPNIILDSLTPAAPPLIQAMLGASGMKLDPQSADIRGGAWVRNMQSNFRQGPQAEQATSLGQISTSTSLIMNALFGAMGSHLAVGLDTLLHASRYDISTGKLTERGSYDFAKGLQAATGEVWKRATSSIPDVPLLWKNEEKYSVTTPTWKYVSENTGHIRSIQGMENKAMGKQAQADQEMRRSVGGMQHQQLEDKVLIRISQEVKEWNAPSGELGKLRKVYQDYGKMAESLNNKYDLSADEQRARKNQIIRLQQDNLEQQHLAMKFKEAEFDHNYGKYLRQRQQGREITMQSLDQMMRESIGGSNPLESARGEATSD